MTNPGEDYAQYLERLAAKTYKPAAPVTGIRTNRYYWLFGQSPEKHKQVILGPFDTEEEAQHVGLELERFEVFELTTRDTAKATREIKAEMIQRFQDGETKRPSTGTQSKGLPIDDALSRMSHKRTNQ